MSSRLLRICISDTPEKKHMPDSPQTSEELLNALNELKSRLKLYQAVFERLDVGIHVIDQNMTTVLYNKAMGHLENENPADILGRPFLDVLSHFRCNEESSTLLRVLRSGETLPDLKQSYINSGGRMVTTINSNQPIIIDGKLSGALEIAKDVTFVQSLADKVLELRTQMTRRGRRSSASSGSVAVSPRVRYCFRDIIGQSPPLLDLLQQARRIAQTSSGVLIYGETGTGKELFAQSIHAASSRADQPFIDVNCAALPSQLLEGLLFGSVKGGFTDAQDKAGLFEQAHGGTLLLDEINSMHLDLQSKLLRVLQEKSLRRLGGDSGIDVDVRVIAIMNKSPVQAINDKELREDLYYRLGVAGLHIPPLRERPEDIPIFVDHFLTKFAAEMGRAVRAVDPEVDEAFRRHPWPGNVRQLEHVIEGALNLADQDEQVLRLEHLPMFFRSTLSPGRQARPARPPVPVKTEIAGNDIRQRLAKEEKHSLRSALETEGGNITRAATRLGITRQLLQYKIKKYGLRPDREI